MSIQDFSKMTLYSGGRAPNPRRVSIFLAEKDVSIPVIELDINKLEQKSEAYSKINPMQRVPALLLEDGTVISESIAICRYVEAVCPQPPLFGETAKEIGVIEMWQRRIELEMLLPIAFAFRHLHPGGAHLEVPQIPEWGLVNQPRAERFLAYLDGELATRSYVAGERFTVADITAIVAYQFLKPARIAYPEHLTNLQRWREDVVARPSVAV